MRVKAKIVFCVLAFLLNTIGISYAEESTRGDVIPDTIGQMSCPDSDSNWVHSLLGINGSQFGDKADCSAEAFVSQLDSKYKIQRSDDLTFRDSLNHLTISRQVSSNPSTDFLLRSFTFGETMESIGPQQDAPQVRLQRLPGFEVIGR